MATLTEKVSRRYRVQFTISKQLHCTYTEYLKIADELKLTIDFGRDFDRWFAGQLEQVRRQLFDLTKEQTPGHVPVDSPIEPDFQVVSVQMSGSAIKGDAGNGRGPQ